MTSTSRSDPAGPFLPARARGINLGVATNDAEASMARHLQSAGVTSLFDFAAGFDSGHGHKPGAGPLLAFAEAVDVTPERCAMVGDSTHDLEAARAASMVAVGVLTGPADEPELAPHADVVLPHRRYSRLAGWPLGTSVYRLRPALHIRKTTGSVAIIGS